MNAISLSYETPKPPTQFGMVALIARRELAGYFTTPLAYVFLVAFLVLAGVLTFFHGQFFVAGQADLQVFFNYHPWLYLFFVPVLTMRLWAEERKSGTIELLMTLPATTASLVLGKFVATWLFVGVALLCTLPMVWTVNYLGQPDLPVIWLSYLGSWLMAAGFITIGSFCSVLTNNQVIAFVLAAAVSFLFVFSGTQLVLGLFGAAPAVLKEGIAGISVLAHYQPILDGVLGVGNIVFFALLAAVFLTATVLMLNVKKGAV